MGVIKLKVGVTRVSRVVLLRKRAANGPPSPRAGVRGFVELSGWTF